MKDRQVKGQHERERERREEGEGVRVTSHNDQRHQTLDTASSNIL